MLLIPAARDAWFWQVTPASLIWLKLRYLFVKSIVNAFICTINSTFYSKWSSVFLRWMKGVHVQIHHWMLIQWLCRVCKCSNSFHNWMHRKYSQMVVQIVNSLILAECMRMSHSYTYATILVILSNIMEMVFGYGQQVVYLYTSMYSSHACNCVSVRRLLDGTNIIDNASHLNECHICRLYEWHWWLRSSSGP